MRNLKDFVSDWIRDKETDECRGDMVNCGNELVMVRLEGDGGLLNYGLPDGRHDHAALFIMRGELHLTLNGNRIGLLAPAYIDFVLPNRWENIELKAEVEVYLMAAETGFFHEVTSKLRTRISERMMAFAQSPFIFFRRCCQNGVTGFCFVFINDGTDRCISERACPKSDVRFFM